ncbi:hypothetical protein ABT124_47305 [Streptomyces sp. NPDC001982]
MDRGAARPLVVGALGFALHHFVYDLLTEPTRQKPRRPVNITGSGDLVLP